MCNAIHISYHPIYKMQYNITLGPPFVLVFGETSQDRDKKPGEGKEMIKW